MPLTKSLKKGTKEKREALRANQIEHLREEDLTRFNELLLEIKNFRSRMSTAEAVSLSYFEDVHQHYLLLIRAQTEGIWGTPLDSVDRRLLQHSLRLMKNICALQDNLKKLDEDSLFYSASCQLWSQALELMQEVLYNSRNNVNFSGRERRLEALNFALYRAAQVVSTPQDAYVRTELLKASEQMRNELEGHYLFRDENRFWAGFVGVLGFVLGLTLYLTGIVTAPLSMVGGMMGIVGGLAIMTYCANMIYNAVWPDQGEKDELRKEKDHSSKFSTTFSSLLSLAKNPATLFSKEGPREDLPLWKQERSYKAH